MLFKIITPERIVFSEEVSSVSLMTPDGEITVLPHHVPLVTLAVAGEIRYTHEGVEKHVAVSGGFTEIKADNSITILADTAEHAAEIDLDRAEAARAKASKLMSEVRDKEDVNYAALSIKIEKELARIKTGNKYRKLRS